MPFQILLLEEESAIGLHGATGLRGRRDLAHAWIRNAGGEGRRAELVIGEIKAWMIYEICGIHANLKVRRFPLRNVEGLTDR